MNDDMKLTQLTITRTLGNDGKLGFSFTHQPQEISFVETLGLLLAAIWHIFNSMNSQYGDQ